MGNRGMRRSHRKSRGGCSFCKRRRIKCDEKKPNCTNCIKRSLVCSLGETFSPSSTLGKPCQTDHFVAPLRDCPATTGDDCGPGFNMDVQDLSLFHHYCFYTSTTFSPDTVTQGFWNVTVPQLSFSYPFLLRAILAIGGLHMDRVQQSAGSHSWRKTKATHHWNAAIQLATPHLIAIDDQSCDPLFVFTMLTCLHTFAEGPQENNYLLFTNDTNSQWPIFFRGLRSVADASIHLGMPSSDRPLAFMYGIAKMNLDELPPEELNTSWSRALVDLRCATLDSLNTASVDRIVYVEALHRLTTCFSAVFGDDDIKCRPISAQTAFAWLYHVSEEFMQRLQTKENIALAFFAFFVVLLKHMDGVWMLEGWPDHLMSGIYNTMSPVTRIWIRWPMQQIEWQPLA
ncbi:retinol dehydrogenase 12 [Colletotrichum truncatum]|uniref:Retinol dehydrogenase 12 n=1 Tax=Colletotrichum truncatum TaxID=5467 RepID=A0ACC3YYN2_COLTU|nr:retinol dehydrogenase 12 [Colletotrichum truncatum]KAF6782009.1 retinol dehydrogenase 12 [Colletotrichum truncatum]